MYDDASEIAKQKNKKLMVIGDPCHGHMFPLLYKIIPPNCGHGDVTLDLYGCDECDRQDINDLSSYETNAYVVMETGTLPYSKNIPETLEEIKRISGGDFLSAGGNNNFTWRNLGAYWYDNSGNLKYCTWPFDYRKDTHYLYYDRYEKQHKKEKFASTDLISSQ